MSMPVCFYPTTVVFVDDTSCFTNQLVSTYGKNSDKSVGFSEAYEALSFINKNPINRYKLKLLECGKRGVDPWDWEIFDLRKIANDAEKVDDISVVVLDYDMPELNGIDLSQQIANPNIKRILLTGAADERIAVEAFQNGLIHGYVKKSDPLFMEKIESYIYQCQLQYFHEVFGKLTHWLEDHNPHKSKSPIFSLSYSHALQKAKESTGAIEYYLSDYSGSVRLVDKQGNSHTLIVRTPQDYEHLQSEAVFECISEDHQSLLSRNEGVLCLDWKTPEFRDCVEWEKNIKPAQRVSEGDVSFSWRLEPRMLSQPAGHYLQPTQVR